MECQHGLMWGPQKLAAALLPQAAASQDQVAYEPVAARQFLDPASLPPAPTPDILGPFATFAHPDGPGTYLNIPASASIDSEEDELFGKAQEVPQIWFLDQIRPFR